MSRKMYASHDGERGSFYGDMGEVIPSTLLPKRRLDWIDGNLHVGDLVTVIKEGNDYPVSGILTKSDCGDYFVMGYWKTDLYRFTEIRKVLPHELVTDAIAMKLHNITIVEPKRMTMQEVEKELGYPFIIVRGDEDGERE